jgi:hypothetical protein
MGQPTPVHAPVATWCADGQYRMKMDAFMGSQLGWFRMNMRASSRKVKRKRILLANPPE